MRFEFEPDGKPRFLRKDSTMYLEFIGIQASLFRHLRPKF